MSKNRALIAIRTFALIAVWLTGSNLVWAQGPQGAFRSAVDRLEVADGPEVYTAVRKIWAAWGDANPADVERTLSALAADPRLTPATRAYAGFFAAHARTRRGDLVGARQAVANLGFVRDWQVLGPFDNEGKAGFERDFGPEADGPDIYAGGRGFAGKERTVRWRRLPSGAFPNGWVEGSSLFRPEEHVCFYATTVFTLDAPKAQQISLWAGVGGAFKLYVNGVLALTEAAYRGHDVDRAGVSVEVPPGPNRLLLKVCGGQDAPAFSLRIANADGAPLARAPKIDPEQSGVLDPAQHAKRTARVRDAELGPVARFERLIAQGRNRARVLHGYAEYLIATDGDDPAMHWARDYAQRAAELEPTIQRLLLIADLAEDQNLSRVWLERAEALATPGAAANPELLLARAQLERGGLNWRDAFPYYRAALEADPGNLEAVRGVVELYNEVDLSQSALAVLERAVRLQPYSVNLLNMLATQLRGLGRERDALEVEARYAQFRFDDASQIDDRIDVALLRGDTAAAAHWVERLLALNPGSIWARSIAATAYRKMGQPQRAIAEFQAALALAPEDVTLLRSLSDLQGELGARDEQLRLLRLILTLKPQTKEVAEYVEHIEPEKTKQDEAYAWSAERFLTRRSEPAAGENRRTLVDLSVTTVFENGLSRQFRQVVFQPLTDSAAALSRSYSFGFQADSQQVELRGAKIYRADGRIDESIDTGVGPADDPSIAMYTSTQVYYVQFPRLEPGDVVELRYRIDDVTPRNEFADYFGDVQYFQKSEPVAHAQYVLITPKSRKLYIDSPGIPGLKTSQKEVGDQRIYDFVAENLPPVVPEQNMPPWPEVLGFVHVSTYPDYQALGRWYWGISKDQFDLDDETRKLAHSIADAYPTPREKVNAVYQWVTRNTRYVALEFGIYGIKPRRCVQTVARGWGDCKDKATVIVSLLKELGIDSTIVILRTQMRGGFRSQVASLAPFDHAIAYVPSMDLYLDGTAEFTGSNELPAMDQGALGILVNQGASKLVNLPITSPTNDRRTNQTTIDLDASGRGDVRVSVTTRGTEAPSWRRRYQAKGMQRERLITDLAQGYPGLELLPGAAGISVDVDDVEKPVTVQIAGRVPTIGRREGTNISLAVTSRVRLADEYAATSRRTLPVAIDSFGTVEDSYEVQLPAGYRVISGPKDQSGESRFGKYSVSVQQLDRKVTVKTSISLAVNRIAVADYPAWRSFCQTVDAAMAPRLVVGK